MSYQIPPQVNDVFQVTMDKKSGLVKDYWLDLPEPYWLIGIVSF